MKNKGVLPIPFLILVLAGIVSLFSILADRGSKASMVRDDSLQMQTVEQERMAVFYFRILSWFADLTPRTLEPVKPHAQPTPVPKAGKTMPRPAHQSKIELCTFRLARMIATGNSPTRSVD